MSTSETVGDAAPDAARDVAAAHAAGTDGVPSMPAPPWRRGGFLSALLALAAAVTILPALTGIPYYLTHGDRYHPWSDHALIELQVRAIGHHPVLLGPFSREGWHHPGPAMYYLIAGPYHLLGDSSSAAPIVTLLLNAVCVVIATLLVRRLLGPATAVGFLAVIVLYLRLAPGGFWRDPWNPYIAVLPLLVAVLAALVAIEGHVRWFPLAVGAASFSVECHVGFTLPAGAVLGLSALVLLVRPIARPIARPGPDTLRRARLVALGDALRRHRGAIGASVLVAAAMWALPIGQQIFGKQGNLTLIWDYLRTHSPTTSRRLAVRVVASQLGAVPGYVTGRRPGLAGPDSAALLPLWTAGVAVMIFALAAVVAVRLRHRVLILLATTTAVVTLTAVVAVSRIVGPVFAYLVTWTAIAGVLLWTTVVATVVVAVRRGLASRSVRSAGAAGEARVGHRARFARPVGPVGPVRPVDGLTGLAGLAALAVIVTLTAFTVHDTAQAPTGASAAIGTPGDSLDVAGLSEAVRTWLGPAHDHDTVRVAPTGSGGATIVDPTLLMTPGVVLDLRKHGVDARVDPGFANAYGPAIARGSATARWQVFVLFGPRGELPPGVTARLLGRSGEFAVYGGSGPAAAGR
ncbi:MAG: hypothetical protein ACQSGP_30705 [Frankia sp.]